MKYTPYYDKSFKPLSLVLKDYKERVEKSVSPDKVYFSIERHNGYNYQLGLDIFSDPSMYRENLFIIERLIKTALWIAGGYKITILGKDYIFEYIKNAYKKGGLRAFDSDFMSTVYERSFIVERCNQNEFPKKRSASVKIGGHTTGCRIGFDAGGSDRKVSAVIDGKVVYAEEVVWSPKTKTDYNYHKNEIRTAFLTAKSHLPRLDAIGVSSAGVYIDNKVKVASLFIKVDKKDFKPHVENIYTDLAQEFGVPITVANDGDVTALAGAIKLKRGCVLGIAMGTSQAGGYINKDGGIDDILSELAFVPVDVQEDSPVDEWSKDFGVGAKYFSQDGVIRLAELAGVTFNDGLTQAEKLKVVQDMAKAGDMRFERIFKDIGIYLGYAIAYYANFYQIEHVLLLGRALVGGAGRLVKDMAERVLSEEFPKLNKINIILPDDNKLKLEQSAVAATLTQI